MTHTRKHGDRLLSLVFGAGLLALLAGMTLLAMVLVTQGVDKASNWAQVLGTILALVGAVVSLVTEWRRRARRTARQPGKSSRILGTAWAVSCISIVAIVIFGSAAPKGAPTLKIPNRVLTSFSEKVTCRQTTAKPDALSVDKAAVLYEVASDKNLYWHKHLDSTHGNTPLDHGQRKIITPAGWNDYVMITAAQDGVPYAVDRFGDLYWYRHLDPEGGSNQWANQGRGKQVGSGWLPSKFLVASSDGVLYRVLPNSDMFWYRHKDTLTSKDQRINGGDGKPVGKEWLESKFLTAASDGVFYRVLLNGDMLWYRHEHPLTGEDQWANNGVGKPLGVGWLESKFLASCGDGVLYRVFLSGDTLDGNMLWYRHENPLTGENQWSRGGVPKLVGIGW